MKSSDKGGTAAPFAALGLLALCTVAFGLWNRGLIPTITPSTPSPLPSPLSTAPYYVRLHIGKHFNEEKNLVLEVPFLADGQQHKEYEKMKGIRWLIDIRAVRYTNTNINVQVQAKKTDASHGKMPRQAMLRGGGNNAGCTACPNDR